MLTTVFCLRDSVGSKIKNIEKKEIVATYSEVPKHQSSGTQLVPNTHFKAPGSCSLLSL